MSWPPAAAAVTSSGAREATADFLRRQDATVNDLGTQFAWSTAASVLASQEVVYEEL